MADLATSSSGGGSGSSSQQQQQQQKEPMETGHVCVVCGDESDGLHFGRFTCRACAAFFRRTVSLKLQYTCKRDGNCEVDKEARNMCRACRYEKCLRMGMLTSAVQHSRDGIGKRSRSVQREQRALSTDAPADVKMARAFVSSTTTTTSSAPSALTQPLQPPAFLGGGAYPFGQPIASAPGPSSLLEQATTAATILQLNVASAKQPFAPFASQSQPQHLPQHQQHPYVGDFGTVPSNILSAGHAQPQAQQQQLGGHQLQPQLQQLSNPSAAAGGAEVELKYLRRMLDGYHHFLSLRKASYTLVDGFPLSRRDNEDCPQSNFGTSKKICKIEASLIMDIVEKFTPFGQLPIEDKHKLFDPFYCLFSNTERAYRTYKMFGAEDDRLLMPDGGYVRLSELQKFYENNTLVRGDPSQVAKIFENAMHYLVKTVVAHMRSIDLSEMELMALFGMFIWSDSQEISPQSLLLANQVRNDIIVDLHLYYRAQGYSEAEVTLKTANLFLLIPKLENSVKLMKENFCISELFNLMNLGGMGCKSHGCVLLKGE